MPEDSDSVIIELEGQDGDHDGQPDWKFRFTIKDPRLKALVKWVTVAVVIISAAWGLGANLGWW